MSMDRHQGSPVDCFDERASLLEKTTPTLADPVSDTVGALHCGSHLNGTSAMELVFSRAVYSRVTVGLARWLLRPQVQSGIKPGATP